ncbi:golgin subfamily A member 2-like isoform X3 [Haliotis rufescens]|uniref:golgin subfamily A member 2-like isoform X3 n=1 Tax=Haliotis rufescens TaxID=6454 RepID=UPI00201EAFAE|nr:golgin subfamily A member 2-like isoform X3 [Haliotis rufescens]
MACLEINRQEPSCKDASLTACQVRAHHQWPKMADSSKRDKIAAAKKRLKQFQQKSGRTPTSSPAQATKTNKDKTPNKENICTNLSPEQSKVPESNCETNDTPSPKSAVDARQAEEQPKHGHSQWFGSSTRTTSSTESLQQLSRQINGLLAETSDFVNGEEMDTTNGSSVAELEKRNRELAALLEKYSSTNEQLTTQIEQVRSHAKTLQEQLDQERDGFDDKHKKDVGSLREQLQVHIQTIGILVAEKTELQSQVSQSQRIAEQRLDEIEELSGRLKASRQRVADLERNVSSVSSSSQQYEKTLEEANRESTKEIDRLKMDLYKANKSKDEFQQQSSELSEKLSSKVGEFSSLEQTVAELRKRLEMAELYAQQLSSESETSSESVKVVEQLQVERDTLIAKIHQYDESFHKVAAERDQISEQYRHYTEQLQQQSQELSQQVSSMAEEREQLLARQHHLEASALELQRKLEEAVVVERPVQESVSADVPEELERVRLEYQELTERHESQVRDNAQLSRFLEEKEERISELESTVSTLGEEAGDKAQLLENIQSDKTALSRALTQNKDLKQQLAELQSGFVKLSNENMEMMTKLQGEEHSGNELGQRLAQQEDEIKDLRESVSSKDREMSELQKVVSISQREEYQQDQIQDRLRHYEAQAQLVDTLQNELTSAQDMMDALTTQNRELRAMLIRATEVKANSEHSIDADNESKRDGVMESLQSTIQQLESERSQLVDNLREQRDLSDSLGIKVADLQEEILRKNQMNFDNDIITRADYDQLKMALEMIQDKYSRVMRDKAELTDKADMLEHMVTQLQGETDTIGEYISLYHHQRALLQQREHQKNDYITQLARDREEMQGKLGQLQALVMQLLGERNMLHSYTEEASRPADISDLEPHLNSSLAHKQGHKHHHHRSAMTNGVNNNYDWPDYTSSESDSESEVEPIVGGTHDTDSATPTEEINQPMLTDTPSPDQSLNTEDTDMNIHKENHAHGTKHMHRTLPEEDQTAHRILHLLSEIGHSNLVEKPPFTERNFLPCKFCQGPIHIV